jgi:hypothetical protein
VADEAIPGTLIEWHINRDQRDALVPKFIAGAG